MTIYIAGKSFLVKTKQTAKAQHLSILQLKPVIILGKQKVAINLIAGKLSLIKGKR